jgi:hypothetical protein
MNAKPIRSGRSACTNSLRNTYQLWRAKSIRDARATTLTILRLAAYIWLIFVLVVLLRLSAR